MFGLSGRNIPRVRSYSDALKVHECAYQHDRFGGHARGLSSTRDTTKTVRKEGQRILFKYHKTDVVVWEPERFSVTCYNTQSTTVFANCLTPPGIITGLHDQRMYAQNNQGYFYPSESEVGFILENSRWIVDTGTIATWDVETLNRQRAARIRQILKPFLNWKESVERLQGSRISETGTAKADVIEYLKRFLAEGKIPEDTYMHLARHGAGYGENFLPQCYILGGAVHKAPATFGSLWRVSKYHGLSAWAFV